MLMKACSLNPYQPSKTGIGPVRATEIAHPSNPESWFKPRQVWQVIVRCLLISFLVSLPSLLATTRAVWAATDPVPSTYYQNLVELFNRKSMSVQKPSALLVEGGYWQSERVIFRDVTYGSEVWRLTNDPDYSIHHDSVNRTPWNCDGSLISFMSPRYVPGLPYTHWFRWYIMDGNGGRFRVISPNGVSKATDIPDYAGMTAWDRFNPSYIYFGYFDGLYKMDVSNADLMTLEESLPYPDRRKEIVTYLSEDNRVMVNDHNTYQRDGTFYPNIYMIDLNKPHGASGRVISYNLHFNLTGITGHDVANECCFHDMMFMRTRGNTFQVNYETPDMGEYVTFEIPYSGNRDSVKIAFTANDPVWPYYSHPFWRYDGKYVVYGGQSQKGVEDWGMHLRNQETQTPIRALSPWHAVSGNHTAWDGYDSTWVFSSVYNWDWGNTIIKMKTDGTDSGPFVNTYTNLNGPYLTLSRAAQSPDATKAFFTSSMLQASDTNADIYIAVARRPYPPVNVRVSSLSQSQVLLAWNRPRIAREIEGFHVYRSVDSDNHFLEISSGLLTEQGYVDNTLSAGHTYYYAVSSEEHSGIESDYLSNVVRVSISSSSATWDNYSAEGLKGWDATPPASVTALSVSQLSAGVYQLTWQGPPDKDVRYYNIYYSVAGPPACTQQRLIASPGGTSTKFIDWQANPAYAPFYGVTAVDRAGNESLPRYFPSGDSDTVPPGPVRDLR
jgi:hypothetical protein